MYLFYRLAELSIDHLQKRWTEVYEQGKDRMEIDKGIKYLLQVRFVEITSLHSLYKF